MLGQTNSSSTIMRRRLSSVPNSIHTIGREGMVTRVSSLSSRSAFLKSDVHVDSSLLGSLNDAFSLGSLSSVSYCRDPMISHCEDEINTNTTTIETHTMPHAVTAWSSREHFVAPMNAFPFSNRIAVTSMDINSFQPGQPLPFPNESTTDSLPNFSEIGADDAVANGDGSPQHVPREIIIHIEDEPDSLSWKSHCGDDLMKMDTPTMRHTVHFSNTLSFATDDLLSTFSGLSGDDAKGSLSCVPREININSPANEEDSIVTALFELAVHPTKMQQCPTPLPVEPHQSVLPPHNEAATTRVTETKDSNDKNREQQGTAKSHHPVPEHKKYVPEYSDMDVLFGRGSRSNNHPGNIIYSKIGGSSKRALQTSQRLNEDRE